MSPDDFSGEYVCDVPALSVKQGRNVIARNAKRRFIVVYEDAVTEKHNNKPDIPCQSLPGNGSSKRLGSPGHIYAYPIEVALGQPYCLVVNVQSSVVTWFKIDLINGQATLLHSLNKTNPNSSTSTWPSFLPGMEFQGTHRERLIISSSTTNMIDTYAYGAITKPITTSTDPRSFSEKTIFFTLEQSE